MMTGITRMDIRVWDKPPHPTASGQILPVPQTPQKGLPVQDLDPIAFSIEFIR
jgi:hypothetical protein